MQQPPFTGAANAESANQAYAVTNQAHRPAPSQEWIKSLFDHNLDGVFSLDREGRFTAANPACEKISGYSPDELLKKTFMELCTPDCLQETILAFEDDRDGQSRVVETSIFAKDGRRVELLATGGPIVVEGQIVGVFGIVKDITERKRIEKALRESEEQFRLLVDGVKEYALFLLDPAGKIVSWNKGAERLKGYRAEEIIGRSSSLCFVPEDILGGDPQRRLEVAAREGRYKSECWVVRKDGSKFWAEVLLTALRNEDGTLRGFAEVAQDITERKRVEQALRESEEKFRTVAENAQAAFGIVRGERFIYANRCFAEWSGYSVEELLQTDFPQLVHPDFRPMLIERARRRQRGEPVPTHYEFLLLTKSGETRWVDFSPAKIEYQGQPAIIGTGFDITDRKRAEEQLRRSESSLRLLSDTATRLLVTEHATQALQDIFDAVASHIGADVYINYLVMPDGSRLRLNAWRGLDEATAKAMEFVEFGQPFCGIAAQERWRVVVPRLQACCEPQAAGLKALGIRVYACHPLMDHGVLGTITFCARDRDQFTDEELGIMRAVADQASMALARQHLTIALEQRAAALDQANRAKDHFLAVLSHELRTPLTPVLTTVQMTEHDPTLSPALRESLVLIHRNVELEARLIDDLLDVTRISRGKIELHLGPVDLHSVLGHVVEVCNSDIRAKQLDLTVQLNALHHHVQGDSARLQQVFWNLLKNAVKFTPMGGSIVLCTDQPAEDRIAITVKDSGVGIEPELLPHIFNVFEQGGHNVTRLFGGLGLGLSISKGLVDMHGGTLLACSDGKGRGSVFTVVLPASLTAETASPHRGFGSAGAAGLRGGRLLLVEDHPDTARTMAMLLRSYGYDVRIADSVSAALHAADAEDFDLLISDLGLPDGSGLDLMRQICAQHPIKGIAVSGYGMEEDVRRSKEAGFMAHLTKPIDINQLEGMIAEISRGSPSPCPETG